jgi:hypothetical protein
MSLEAVRETEAHRIRSFDVQIWTTAKLNPVHAETRCRSFDVRMSRWERPPRAPPSKTRSPRSSTVNFLARERP